MELRKLNKIRNNELVCCSSVSDKVPLGCSSFVLPLKLPTLYNHDETIFSFGSFFLRFRVESQGLQLVHFSDARFQWENGPLGSGTFSH